MSSSSIGIKEILSKLDDDDLYSLAGTVTQGLLKNKITTTEEAILTILKYSPNELSVLRRKVVTREILFAYLHEHDISFFTPITKNELIDKILDYWKGPEAAPEIPISEPEIQSEICSNENNGNGHSISVLAEQFVKWFYTMFNSSECIGSEHFYPDCKLKVNVFTGEQCDCLEVVNNPEEVSATLFQTKMKYNIFFNPNISKEGVQGRMDPHGLVIVLACGTLHISDTCAGVFEQVFALARDPYCDNNWKIKNTDLNLRSKNDVIGPPRLCDSELTSNLLTLPSA